MTTTPTPRDDAAGPHVAAVADDALHGSYCPKLCTHTCPVTSATGREDAVPWQFHRTVADLADGRLPLAPEVHDRLTACSGCLACRQPCAFDQDVPRQVRAGRAALVEAGHAPSATADAVAHVAAGRSPGGRTLPSPPAPDDDPTVTLLGGCRDGPASLEASVALLRAAGERVRTVLPDGCCGALLDDLGAVSAAADARDRLPTPGVPVVASDPHCLDALRRAGHSPRELTSTLAAAVVEGRLRFPDQPDATPVTWHDPCVLARGEGIVDAPRSLLAAAGLPVREAVRCGADTGCSGAGLGLELLDPDAADATARARIAELPSDTAVVTSCARAGQRLTSAGADTRDLAVALAARLAAPTDATEDRS